MSSQQRPGALIVSVDVDAACLRGDLNMQRTLNSTTVALLGVLGNHGVAGTWALCDPANSLMTERLVNDAVPHELALLSESGWSGPNLGRVRFARELTGRVQDAQSQGLKLETLALCDRLPLYHDLLVKCGLSALRGPAEEGRTNSWWPNTMRTSSANGIQPLRWGLWQVKSTWRNFEGGLMSSRRGIDRSACTGGLITWVLDGPKLAAGGASMLRLIDRVLAYAVQRRNQGGLNIETVRGFVNRQLKRPESSPAESILRAKAA
jgi:hypothetical protein